MVISNFNYNISNQNFDSTESTHLKDFTNVLPPELSLQIFNLLDTSSLPAASMASREWQKLTNDGPLWKAKCEESPHFTPSVNNSNVTRSQKRKLENSPTSDDQKPKRRAANPNYRNLSKKLVKSEKSLKSENPSLRVTQIYSRQNVCGLLSYGNEIVVPSSKGKLSFFVPHQLIKQFDIHQAAVTSFKIKGNQFLLGYYDGVFESYTMKEDRLVLENTFKVDGLLSPDSLILDIEIHNGKIYVLSPACLREFDPATKTLSIVQAPNTSIITAFAFIHSQLFAALDDCTIRRLNFATGEWQIPEGLSLQVPPDVFQIKGIDYQNDILMVFASSIQEQRSRVFLFTSTWQQNPVKVKLTHFDSQNHILETLGNLISCSYFHGNRLFFGTTNGILYVYDLMSKKLNVFSLQNDQMIGGISQVNGSIYLAQVKDISKNPEAPVFAGTISELDFSRNERTEENILTNMIHILENNPQDITGLLSKKDQLPNDVLMALDYCLLLQNINEHTKMRSSLGPDKAVWGKTFKFRTRLWNEIPLKAPKKVADAIRYYIEHYRDKLNDERRRNALRETRQNLIATT